MRHLLSSLFLAPALVLTSCQANVENDSQPTTEIAQVERETPEDWDLNEIAEAASFGRSSEREPWDPIVTHVLVWKVREDNRPLKVEECLVLQHQKDPNKNNERWVLASLYRHPEYRNEWEVSERTSRMLGADGERFCHRERHYETYEVSPRNADVYAFMDKVDWKLGADDGWRLLGRKICRQTWRTAIGEEPTRRFSD